ncbi:hypothetical protein [Paraburkholderia sp. BL10I2N1]|uniref:hypothetical protein n=1 Tax=Paraburkholderia sp. BL10I2N1 TaxID=1938796 RepID=UPI001060FF99|nr:hypothetical protein [Paraburkholderia sp. BL10I2N1]TDN57816.1 hypothetical protein B0G77_8656 [Paraburkholderia sp. BL10I2N1]
MGILDWLLHRGEERALQQESERVMEAIERILAINPRLQMAQRYRERLAEAVTISVRYEDSLVGGLPAPHDASVSAWSSDPCIRAFFATSDDIPRAFSRSRELRAHFERYPDSAQAYAVLGMAMTERHVLGVALEGDTIRSDVAQTTLCFRDHRARICGRTEAELRQEIRRLLVDQLALEGLEMLDADRRELVAQGRELLRERLALLQSQGGVGVGSMVGEEPEDDAEELARVQARIEENASNLAALRVPTDLIELELERVCKVLSDPSTHLYVTKKRVRIDLMNVVQENVTQGGHEIEFDIARLPGNPPQMRAFALVRYPRAELLPAGLHIDAAMRAL